MVLPSSTKIRLHQLNSGFAPISGGTPGTGYSGTSGSQAWAQVSYLDAQTGQSYMCFRFTYSGQTYTGSVYVPGQFPVGSW